MNGGKRIFFVLVAAAIWLFSLPASSYADSRGGEAAVLGRSGDSDASFAGEEEEVRAPDLVLRLAKTTFALGESFRVDASFARPVEGNTVVLTLQYQPESVTYQGFDCGDGVTMVDERAGDGECRVTLMIPDYRLTQLGCFSLLTAAAAEQYGMECMLSAAVDYVVREEGGKTVGDASAESAFLLVVDGDVNRDGVTDLLDFSDLIDCFGLGADDEGWDAIRWFDTDGNGTIDIFDISLLAGILGAA